MLKESQKAIGVFDSGVGGTSIWKEIRQLLPKENTIYLSDSKNAPYGKKSRDEIIYLSEKNTDFLLEQDAKIIVVACNTATTNAIKHLREKYDIPFIGIEPAIKPAALHTKTNVVGVLATKGTLSSKLFEKTSSAIGEKVKIIEQVGKGLVELIESGRINSKEMDSLLESHLQAITAHKIDCLVLGCTHYPYLIPKIRQIIGGDIKIIDSGEAVARQTKNILIKHNLLNTNKKKGRNIFITNKRIEVLSYFLEDVKNTEIKELPF